MSEPGLSALVRNFLRTLSLRQMATVWAEDFIGMLLRPIPGFLGFTLRWLFYRVLFARLGGYLARTRDPPPGNTVIWRGLSRLTDIALGAKLAIPEPRCG